MSDFNWTPEGAYEAADSGTQDGPGWAEVDDGTAYVYEPDGGLIAQRSDADPVALRAWVEARPEFR